MRYLAAVLAVFLAWEPVLTVRAQDGAQPAVENPPRPPDIPPGDDTIQPVERGDRAPFAGQLLDTDTAIRWTNRLRWYQEELQLRIHTEELTLQAVQASHATELRIVEESYQREVLGLREDARRLGEQLAQAQNRPWYDTVGFGMLVGAVVVVLLDAAAIGLYAALK